MKKLIVAVMCLGMLAIGCAAGDTALKGMGVARCMDDYKYVDGDCVLRDPSEPPDLYSNSQAAVDRWNKEHAQPVVEETKKDQLYDTEIAWRVDDIEASAEAAYNNKPLMVFITTNDDWCGPCKDMEKKTFKNPTIIKILNKHFVTLKYQFDNEDAKKYKVKGLPAYIFIKVDDKTKTSRKLGRAVGYRGTIDFTRIMATALMKFNESN